MKIASLIFLALLLTPAYADPVAKAWSKADKPSLARAESIGKVTAGCLRGAQALPINGVGYQVMRLSRKRYYGHPDLVNFIEQLGQAANSQRLGTLLVGDLGQARGGPTPSGHRSHQTGLDVDIWYLLSDVASRRELSASERESWSAPSVVKNAGGIDAGQWSMANEKILEAAARSPEVDRIFVNAHVKAHLCNGPGKHDWLQKIRPWHAHADHFHVRLKCPAGSGRCDKQEPVPAGDGCGADLAWWFSEDAKKPKPKAPPYKLVLPDTCNTVLYE